MQQIPLYESVCLSFKYHRKADDYAGIIRLVGEKVILRSWKMGEWQHYNSDVTVDLALKFVEKVQK